MAKTKDESPHEVFKFDQAQLEAALSTIESFKPPPPTPPAAGRGLTFDQFERVFKIAALLFAFLFGTYKFFAFESERESLDLEKSRTELSIKKTDLALKQVHLRGQTDQNLEWTVTMDAEPAEATSEDGVTRYVATFGMTFKNLGEVPIEIQSNTITAYLGAIKPRAESAESLEEVRRVNEPDASRQPKDSVKWDKKDSVTFRKAGGGLAKLGPDEVSQFKYQYIVHVRESRYLAMRSVFQLKVHVGEGKTQLNRPLQGIRILQLESPASDAK